MGHGARGLQRQRDRVGVPAARPRPLAGVSLGGGRPGRVLRRRAAPLPRACALERPRRDPEGAHLRADGKPGQPRRGRQGVLVVSRCDAEPLVEPLALPLSTERVPVRAARRGERDARQAGSGIRAARHGGLRRRPLLDRRGRLREGGPARPAADGADHERRPRRRHAPRSADGVVPEHLGLGGGRRQAGAASRGRRRGDGASVPRAARARGRRRSRREPGPSSSSATTRRTTSGSSGAPAHSLRRTGSTTTSSRVPTRSTPTPSGRRRRTGTASRWLPAPPSSCACGCGGRTATRTRGRTSPTWPRPGERRRTSSTPS